MNDVTNITAINGNGRTVLCPECAERAGLARCNMKMQEIGQLFSKDTALLNGTVFPELFMPYEPERNYNMHPALN